MNTGVIAGVPYRDSTYKVRVVHFLGFLRDQAARYKWKAPAISIFQNLKTHSTLKSHFTQPELINRIGVVNASLRIFGDPMFSNGHDGELGDYVVVCYKNEQDVPTKVVWRFVCVDGNYYLVKQECD